MFHFLLIVLQFVPQNIDIGFCNFSQRIEKGLTVALGEVRKHNLEISNFTVQVRLTYSEVETTLLPSSTHPTLTPTQMLVLIINTIIPSQCWWY